MGAFFDMSVLASLAFLAVMLLVGVLLRAKVTFFQNFLVPACIIGGIIGAIIMNTTSIPGINQKLYEQLAYHFFAFSFICLGLRGTGCIQKEECSDTTKELVKGSIWQGFMFYMSMCSQVLVATAVIYLINFIFQKDFLACMGFLGAQGFTAGPGATLSSGLLWEKFGHANMGQVGLAFSGIGVHSFFCDRCSSCSLGIALKSSIRFLLEILIKKCLQVFMIRKILLSECIKSPRQQTLTVWRFILPLFSVHGLLPIIWWILSRFIVQKA